MTQTAFAPAPAVKLSMNVDEILTLFTQKRYDPISEKFLAILEHFRANTIFAISPEEQYFIDQFVKVFLFILSEPNFVISDRFILGYLSFNHVISNLVAISSAKTTDFHVEIIARQQNNIIRLLTIYSARNKFKIDRKTIFNVNPSVASVWFAFYACSYYSALVSELGWENLREHFSFSDPRLRIAHQIQETYFGSTYAGDRRDSLIKPVVNRTVQENMPTVNIRRKAPDKRKVAVASAFWSSNTSVFRIFNGLIRSLKPDFHLTFLQISDTLPPETDLWDDVRKLVTKGGLNFDGLQDNDFQVLHFPDIGMSDGSIILANQRIAPIQIFALGHPVSTFGSRIDYVMSGEDIEPPDHPEQNYSERLVMMPGMGLAHTRPNYTVRNLKKQNPVLIVNLPAWCQKVNYAYVQALKKIQAATHTKFVIRLFSGNSLLRSNDYLPFCQSIKAQLGAENIEIVPPLSYPDYMAQLEHGDLALDAFHFGGGNTVSDNLYVGVPMVCWEGDQWYNRIGPATMRLATLPELIVTNEQEFVDLSVKLIDDEEYRNGLRQKLAGLDLNTLVYGHNEAIYFNKAVHYLIDNHERLQQENSREPIRISR